MIETDILFAMFEVWNKKISNPRRNQHRKALEGYRRYHDEAWAEIPP
jgi:hypothetical protein